jgi:NAD(P)-dependent dehydrogenase (short-subunit alcohol dehydrogenase family)
MAGELEGKVAVVTGGASGMGAATVELLAAEGARVVSTDVSVESGRRVADACGATFVEQDVSDAAGWESLKALVTGEFGRLDVMVNNAGIIVSNPIDEFDLAQWQKVIGVNLTGVALGCHFAIGLMRKNPGGSSGSIVNVASTTAMAGIPSDVGYVASKGGVRALNRSVAVLCARRGYGIRSNCILPGATDTGIVDKAAAAAPGVRERLTSMSPLSKIGRPVDIAQAVLYLASDRSDFVTGTDLLVDGGALAVHPGY